MTTYGVTDNGFVKKTVSAILNDMKEKARAEFGDDIDLNATSALMHFMEVIALEEAKLWDQLENLYYAAFIEYATGENLDRVVALLGLIRQSATPATVTQTFVASQACTVSEGTTIQTDSGVQFKTDEDLVFTGSGSDTVGATAVEPGTEGNVSAGTITNLLTPITGITSTTNVGAATNGADAETDTSLRARAKAYSASLGKGTVDAIVNAVLAVTGVTDCSASEDFDLHKLTLTVTGVSYPNTTVDAAIEDARPAGIEVVWQNPTYVDIYCDATVDVSATAPGSAGTIIRDAIVAYINGLGVGDDVIYTKIYEIIYDCDDDYSEEWVLDVTNLKLDTSDPPTGTSNVSISATQKAQTQDSYVEITIV